MGIIRYQLNRSFILRQYRIQSCIFSFTVNIVLNCLVCYTAEWIFEQLETKLRDNTDK